MLERRGITADTALRLGRFFGTSVEFWMNAQAFYEVRLASARLARRTQTDFGRGATADLTS